MTVRSMSTSKLEYVNPAEVPEMSSWPVPEREMLFTVPSLSTLVSRRDCSAGRLSVQVLLRQGSVRELA